MGTGRIPPSHRKYDVFISFRGEDTRCKFTAFLFEALDKKGIDVYRDDKELERGKAIEPELLEAIEFSRISIIILSRNYASSTWCLTELVKIVHCMKTMGQIVIPIFYDVDPSTVRKQTGYFQEPFAKYERTFGEDVEKVQTWKRALTEVSNLAGFNARNRQEPVLIRELVKDILLKLSVSTNTKFEDLVGIDSRLEKLKPPITTVLPNEVRMVGIYGMGGIGKTTLARVILKLIFNNFDGQSFLANVRETARTHKDLLCLQKQLLSSFLPDEKINISNVYDGMEMISKRLRKKRVLIIIDDVDDVEQLRNLVGRRNWFGLGSLIIITTRNEHVLKAHGVDEKYKVEELNHNEALQLLRLTAFRNHQPSEDFWNLSNDIVRYCGGLPLALKVFGSFLIGRTIEEWGDAIERLKREGAKKIIEILELSFSGLEDTEKEIFLDIACFFKGFDRGYVTRILTGCHFNPIIGINVLIEKSLVTISKKNQLWMHDLLQEMGRQIIKRESPKEPGKRSRLWKKKDVLQVLSKNTATEAVEGIILEEELNISTNAKAFSKMINLRLLKIDKVQLPEGIEYLSNNLRLLEWHRYPLKSLPSNLLLDKIVELDLSYSNIEKLWDGTQILKELKSINLRNCSNLTISPDLTVVPNLEKLNLEGCIRMHEIHPSMQVHKKITHLILRNCSNLTTFPRKIAMESLVTLDLSGCSKLESREEEILEELDTRGTATKRARLSIIPVENIKRWYWRFLGGSSKSVGFMLPSLSSCRFLTTLILRDCNIGEGGIPSEVGEIERLWRLDLSNKSFVSLPGSIRHLRHLQDLFLENCKRLQSLPQLPKSVVFLNANGCVSLERSSDALGLSTSPNSLICFFAFNCPNLFGTNSTALSMLQDYFMHYSSRQFIKDVFHMIVPGSEIPKWCHQKEGCSIAIKRHPHLHRSSKLIGYVVCCVFVIHKHPSIITRTGAVTHRLRFDISSVDQDVYSNNVPGCAFRENSGQAMSEHIWLVFVSRRGYVSEMTKHMYDPVEFSFGIEFGPGLEIRRCGARPIYEQDIADDQFNQSGGSNAWVLNKFPYEDFGGPIVEEVVSQITVNVSAWTSKQKQLPSII